MTIINDIDPEHNEDGGKDSEGRKSMSDYCCRENKSNGSAKRRSILAFAVEHEPPFIPSNVKGHGCSEQEYIEGRERVATRQFMRLVAKLIIKEQLLEISKGVPNEDK